MPFMKNDHEYRTHLVWNGNRGEGTASYAAYGRDYRVSIEGKPVLEGSADATFRGDPHRLNPEDLLVAAISSCHMLAYLALCAREGVTVTAYEDDARGVLRLNANGGGRFEEVTIRPRVVVARSEMIDRARELHARAHESCFIASSCSVPIHHEATVSAS